MNILYIADPNSIHDIKWMSFFSKTNNCYLLVRRDHYKQSKELCSKLELKYNINFIGVLEDFSIRNFGKTLKTKKRIKEELKRYDIQLFHLLFAEPNALWATFRANFGVPMMLTTRGTDVLKTIPSFFNSNSIIKILSSYFYKKALRKFEYIVGTSERQLQSVTQLVGRTSNMGVIRTGVDVELLEADSSNFQVKELVGKKYIFFPRAMRPLYQHELAIKAILSLPEVLHREYSFVFVDKDSSDVSYTNEIQSLMNTNAEVDFVWLTNLDQNHLLETFKNASAVVMTPLSDGTPVTAIEAMLCKVPLLLPPLNYDQEIFGQGVSKFGEFTVKSLATSLIEIIENGAALDLDQAYSNAYKNANRKIEMEKLNNIYESLMP